MSVFEWCAIVVGILQTCFMGLTYWKMYHVEKNSNGMHSHIVQLVEAAAKDKGLKEGRDESPKPSH